MHDEVLCTHSQKHITMDIDNLSTDFLFLANDPYPIVRPDTNHFRFLSQSTMFSHQRNDLHVLVSVLSNHSVSISSTSHAHVRSVFAVGAAGIASIALLKKHLRAQEPESGYLYT